MQRAPHLAAAQSTTATAMATATATATPGDGAVSSRGLVPADLSVEGGVDALAAPPVASDALRGAKKTHDLR